MMTQPASPDAATEPQMEIRGQELDAAATAGVDATRRDVIRRGAGNEGRMRAFRAGPAADFHPRLA